ncbi:MULTISPECIES: DUF262 domain-containing protein [Rhizobium]|uniref:DUF262 domain-containing protein n=1 Tax=Rhizobium TaxID=379 RepID=UPI001ADB1900|nr:MULTISPECIES: DUF262 domain-containing protein [Rhizobium]MBO9102289.1 DUF262 domain-containing protein [Rhizobium sp. L58/93]MBO9172212.1 DUF262 domain-containing protein [Rhizobium sp. L245/93]MBO9187780.1 DUF262 domain-containing protein [Rhizobium sp. E27B/91]QXZ87514.1 DUF262 domain-containing protein [Rhizobium sp. K1/93]QXZ93554.1 DUF262 domain-containing protein [Rhizobium sp. K15/93]
MARSLTTQDISWFLDLNEKGQLDLNPPYQRKSVWSPRDKRYFIDTILNNYPAPPVFLHKSLSENGRATYHVVDGKQRLQTIIDFATNKVRIPDDFSDVNLQRKRWDDLERGTRERFWNYVLIVEMLPDTGDAALKNTFERINRNSRKLTEQEMRHARYDGWLISLAEAEAEKQEWKDFGIVTTARAKRMSDVQFISELIYILLKDAITGFDQDALNEFYAEYEDTSELPEFVEDDIMAKLERVKGHVRSLLALKGELRDQIKVQSHFYTLWAYFVLQEKRLLPIADFADKYESFLAQVSLAVANSLPASDGSEEGEVARQLILEYATNVRGASTDLAPRAKRQRSLTAVIHGLEAAPDENN